MLSTTTVYVLPEGLLRGIAGFCRCCGECRSPAAGGGASGLMEPLAVLLQLPLMVVHAIECTRVKLLHGRLSASTNHKMKSNQSFS